MTATATKAPPSWLTQFIRTVSEQTGLNPAVVYAWTLAEGGPPGNPLNIGPGQNYGNPAQAAVATSRLINTSSNYAGIRRATHASPKAQLDAIIASPWDAGHYRGSPSAAPGTLLYGTYKRVLASTPSQDALLKMAVDQISKHPQPLFGPGNGIDLNPLHGIDKTVSGVESWLQDTAVTALLYVGLTIAALALILLGLSRGTGVGPGALRQPAGFVPAAPSSQTDDIPF